MYWKKFVQTGTDFCIQKTQKWWNFHGTVQCYGLILHIWVTLRSNFLHLIPSSWTALVTQWCFITVLRYTSVHTFTVPTFHITFLMMDFNWETKIKSVFLKLSVQYNEMDIWIGIVDLNTLTLLTLNWFCWPWPHFFNPDTIPSCSDHLLH